MKNYYFTNKRGMMHLKKMTRILSAFLAALTMVMLLDVLPGKVSAAGVSAPVVTISNDKDTGRIELTWKTVKGAAKYEVYRATSKNGTYSRRTTTTKTTYTGTKDEAGKTYYYKVRALTSKGAYAASKAVSATCDLARPVISASNAASTGYPKLTWKAVKGAVSYKVYRAASKSGTYSLMKTTTSTSYINTSAKAGQTYYYKVMAVAAKTAANSAYSAVASCTCDLPRPMVTTANAASTGYPVLTWEAVEGAVSYKVYRSTSKDGTYSLTKTTTDTSYTNTSAKPGNVYYYKVMAVAQKSAANSAYSSIKSRTCDLAQPKVTIDLNAKGKPTLSWEAVEDAVQYKVYRATAEDGTYSVMKTTTGTTYTNTTAEDGTTYFYKVRAICSNTDGNSAYSEILSIRAEAPVPGETQPEPTEPKPTEPKPTEPKPTEPDDPDLVYVKGTSVYVYKSPNSSSKSLRLFYMTELKMGKAVTNGSSGKWYEVFYEGSKYYIWLTPDSDKLTTRKSSMNYEAKTVYQQEIVDLALTIDREWNTKYVSKDSGKVYSDGSVGFDCSGFACYVINTVMQKYNPAYRVVPGTDGMFDLEYVYNKGMKGECRVIDVKLEDAQPGDIVFFKSRTTGRLNHCGLYLGNHEFLHCTSAWDQGVGLMTLDDTYGDLVIGIRRYVPTEVTPANATYYAAQGHPIYTDREGKIKSDMRVSRGEAVTALFVATKQDGNNGIAYIRTKSGTEGFVWFSNYSKTK